MNVTIKKLPQSQVELTVEVPYAEYQKGERHALTEAGKEVHVAGFRSGHIPEDVIRQHVSAATLTAMAQEKTVIAAYAAAVRSHNLFVIAPPKVQVKTPVTKEGDALVFVATVSIMPEVKLGDYKKIKVARAKVEVTDKQVEETIQSIVDRFAEWKDVKRAAQKGDRAELSFEGKDEKGETSPQLSSKHHPVVLGNGLFLEDFETAVIGMNPGETKTADVTFPETYHAAPMRGKKVTFTITLDKLEEKLARALDESLITTITGQKKTVEEFRQQVREDLKAEMQSRADREHDGKVVEEIIKITSVDLPEALVTEELSAMKEEQKARVQKQGLTWEQFLKHVKKTEADFEKDNRKAAEERLKARLGVQHILKDAKIEATDDDVEAHIKGWPVRSEDERKWVETTYKKGSEAYNRLRQNLAADKLIALLSA